MRGTTHMAAASAASAAHVAAATTAAAGVLGISQSRRSRYPNPDQHCRGGPNNMSRSCDVHCLLRLRPGSAARVPDRND
jgi:hypothetical protein